MFDQLVQLRVRRRAVGANADLQHVLDGVALGQLKVLDRPGLDVADARAEGELALLGLVEEVDRDLDLAAAGGGGDACTASLEVKLIEMGRSYCAA